MRHIKSSVTWNGHGGIFRSKLPGGYSSLNNDLSSIEALGRVFPVIFLLVSILVSLTAMSRMVEEERGIIAVYKPWGMATLPYTAST